MSIRKMSRFSHSLIWVILSIFAWLVVGGILCLNVGHSGRSAALVLITGAGIIAAYMILAPDGRRAEERAGRRDHGSAAGSEAPAGAGLSQHRVDAAIGFRSTGGGWQEGSMFSCIMCHFAMELDDVAVDVGNGRGVCLRCYARETSTQLPMPSTLRRAVHAMLDGLTTR
jgi:hypothetical protein